MISMLLKIPGLSIVAQAGGIGSGSPSDDGLVERTAPPNQNENSAQDDVGEDGIGDDGIVDDIDEDDIGDHMEEDDAAAMDWEGTEIKEDHESDKENVGEITAQNAPKETEHESSGKVADFDCLVCIKEGGRKARAEPCNRKQPCSNCISRGKKQMAARNLSAPLFECNYDGDYVRPTSYRLEDEYRIIVEKPGKVKPSKKGATASESTIAEDPSLSAVAASTRDVVAQPNTGPSATIQAPPVIPGVSATIQASPVVPGVSTAARAGLNHGPTSSSWSSSFVLTNRPVTTRAYSNRIQQQGFASAQPPAIAQNRSSTTSTPGNHLINTVTPFITRHHSSGVGTTQWHVVSCDASTMTTPVNPLGINAPPALSVPPLPAATTSDRTWSSVRELYEEMRHQVYGWRRMLTHPLPHVRATAQMMAVDFNPLAANYDSLVLRRYLDVELGLRRAAYTPEQRAMLHRENLRECLARGDWFGRVVIE